MLLGLVERSSPDNLETNGIRRDGQRHLDGACIAANKFPGIRAAVCHDTHVANRAVDHDDVNVLCLGAWIFGSLIAEDVITTFLNATFGTGEDLRRRVEQLREIEQRFALGHDADRT